MMKFAAICLLSAAWMCRAQGAAEERQATYKGAWFEINYPANFKAHALDAAKPKQSNAATFTSHDGAMEFYIFSPQWGGDAPGIALLPATEVEISRKSEKGKSSGVEGVYTWSTVSAKDKSYTRVFQDFLAADGSIHWVIGMKYKSDTALQRYKSQYARFKASLRQLAD